MLVWQERCWSARPSEQLDELEASDDALDAEWVSSLVGLCCFTAHPERGALPSDTASPQELALGGGIKLRCSPGLLEARRVDGFTK